jgi:hypothetical protein
MRTIFRQQLWIAALVAAVGLASWRLTLTAGQPAQKSAGVRVVPAGQPIGGDPGRKGATYYSLEGQTARLITAFEDGTKAVAQRGVDGDVTTTLEDAHGNEVNRLRVGHDVVQYTPFAGTPLMAQTDPLVHPTLDWSNQQSHRLHRDGATSGTRLEWRAGMMRKTAARPASDDGDTDHDVRAIETHWANSLTARTVRLRFKPGFATYNDKPVKGDILFTTLRRDGVEVGHADYLTVERIFAWSMPGISDGAITTENLKPKYGGWLFTPDMVWMNLQTIGTFHWRTLMKEKGTVARRQAAPRNPILEFFVPTVAANDEGCDYLHWIDGTVYRPCCDMHDQCYENNGCAYKTWWQWGNWKCDICNGFVIGCFVGSAGGHILHPWYW